MRYNFPIQIVNRHNEVMIVQTHAVNKDYQVFISKSRILYNINFTFVDELPKDETGERLTNVAKALTSVVRDFIDKTADWVAVTTALENYRG